ncbi:putative CTD small phosphatase-like protein 2 [Hibiscus syriacus]|uniref:CTD small phosphatase-like protein 2 n=1 Tax=Hibiscus syriacus TaxID=106335 RepID=A0A6A2YP26_HIBSY|nr:putative CTD small phosphatase-like protein 2 [Hibiscus syriacus]
MDNMGGNGSYNIQYLEEQFNNGGFDDIEKIVGTKELEESMEGFQAALMDGIEVDDSQLGLDQPPEKNPEDDILHSNEEFSSPSLYNPQSPQNSSGSESSTNVKSDHVNRAGDLLMAVLIGADPNKNKIIEQALGAMEELIKLATMGEPLWQRKGNCEMETLNGLQYLREFGCVNATMEDIVRMVEIGEPQQFPSFDLNDSYFAPNIPTPSSKPEFEPLHIEASREIGFINMNPMNIVELLMDSKQWSMVFSSIVSRTTMVGVILDSVDGSYNGVLQVLRFAFGARRWIAVINKHCQWLATSMTRTTPTDAGVLMPQSGRESLLKLAERVTRNFFMNVGSCTDNLWMALPLSFGAEDVRFRFGNTLAVPGKPPDKTLIFTTSVRMPVPVKILFDFLRHEHSRNKWDLLSNERLVREVAYVINGEDPQNRVSIMQVNSSPNKIEILYLQESYTDKTRSYIVYAPIDTFAMSVILNGGNPNSAAILSSGFTILPDKPPGEGAEPEGSILTMSFQSADSSSTNEVIPPVTLKTIDLVLGTTAALIRDAIMANGNVMQFGRK